MISSKHIKVGQEVYFVNNRMGLEKCEIISTCNENKFIKVHYIGAIDYNGKEICPTYGESFVLETNLFLTLEEAVAYIKKTETDRFNKYKNSIKNLKDLLEFPITNCFSDGDGCQDGLIVKAYKERAYELTGIKLNIY